HVEVDVVAVGIGAEIDQRGGRVRGTGRRVQRVFVGLQRGGRGAGGQADRGLVVGGERRRAIEVQRPVGDAALDGAVDVEVAGRERDGAVGGEAFAGFGGPGRIVEARRAAADGIETVDVARNEIAVLGEDVDRAGIDGAVDVDVARCAGDVHRAGDV